MSSLFEWAAIRDPAMWACIGTVLLRRFEALPQLALVLYLFEVRPSARIYPSLSV